MKITISDCLDVRYKSRDDTHPVCIRIYCNRRYDYVQTGIYLTEIEYGDIHSSKIKPALKDTLRNILDAEAKVYDYLDGNNAYDIRKIRLLLKYSSNLEIVHGTNVSINSENIFDWFDKKINTLRNNGQFGSAECYAVTKNVYRDNLKVTDVGFNFFTVKRLKDLETEMKEERRMVFQLWGNMHVILEQFLIWQLVRA